MWSTSRSSFKVKEKRNEYVKRSPRGGFDDRVSHLLRHGVSSRRQRELLDGADEDEGRSIQHRRWDPHDSRLRLHNDPDAVRRGGPESVRGEYDLCGPHHTAPHWHRIVLCVAERTSGPATSETAVTATPCDRNRAHDLRVRAPFLLPLSVVEATEFQVTTKPREEATRLAVRTEK